MNPNNSNKIMNNWTITALVVGLILGFWAGRYFAGWKASTTGGVEENLLSTTTASVTGEGQTAAVGTVGDSMTNNNNTGDTSIAVIVADQAAGNSVVVTKVTLPERGWVGVRDNNGGMLGKILGAQRVEAGANSGVMIDLLRPTIANRPYFITLYIDNGDGVFNSTTDTMVKGATGPVTYSFKTR